jgi:general secretion pathway protein G
MKSRAHAPSRRDAGFTILEIVIVFILLAGIMAFVGPKIYDMMFKAETQIGKIELLNLAQKIEMYRADVGRYPASLSDLVRQPPATDKWSGPYAKEAELKDKWGNPYQYAVPGTDGRRYDLVSYGADGKPGGEGENRDLTN